MPDSRLNKAERALQQSFRKTFYFNGLLAGMFVLLAYVPISKLPDRRNYPETVVTLSYRAVELPAAQAPLHLAGAWVLRAGDPRFAGLSALAIDHGRFLAVSDLGAVVRFDPPTAGQPKVTLQDLRFGPGRFGKKWSRDAESLAADPRGRGWWVGYEQNHSLWLYDPNFQSPQANVDLKRPDWWNNRGAEGLIANGAGLLVLAENGRDAISVRAEGLTNLKLLAGADVADAARAPDGGVWLLLRTKSFGGISQAIAQLIPTKTGYRAGPAWPVPKAPFDNYEGMAIARRPGGGLRFWLVTDDGHRFMARTLLVALDYVPLARHGKSPATGAGLSRKPNGKAR
jgi:hypothetical protein